ncbi:MAG: ABC transporter ATP-binding protein [Phycisphaerales bacterium]|nr:ABC transporter ATP-binding protein [Phycisphaerales bacterium]
MIKPPDSIVVEAVGLTKVFKDFWMRTKARAVDNVDFEVRRHEIFGLLGPNGSGKSTIIKMILGLLHKTSGRLLVFGKQPTDVSVKRFIGFLPEESYLYRFLNPRETLDYYGKLFGLDHRTRRRRTDELLDMIGLTQVAHRPVGEFSKGMTRRVGLAQALINDPEFLILDEPTSGLDPIGTRQVKDLLIELGRRGKTILLSSHLLADVEDVCDRMVVLYGGKIRAQGTADELLSDTQRTVIQTARLKESTISRIEQVIREAEGLAIDKVQAPRQRLEQLFMDIVEKARQEQVATSGALHGGATAAFLRGDSEGADGEQLIDSLVREQYPQRAARIRDVESDGQSKAAPEPRQDVLADLVKTDQEPKRPRAREAAPIPTAPENVDASVIDSLLGDSSSKGQQSKNDD